MVNKHRGEISARLDGRDWTLCLTLGALAELEEAFQTEDLTKLTERFSKGHLSARDMHMVIYAGLKGGGHALEKTDVMNMQADGGAIGFAKIVVELLTATFGTSTPVDENKPNV